MESHDASPMGPLPSGIPLAADYQACLRSPGFRQLEAHSAQFVAEHRAQLSAYQRRWVEDPLHQWSRQWEYPFVLQAIAQHARRHESAPRVLDAGAGFTFFPYFLAQRFPGMRVDCCDQDGSLAALHETASARKASQTAFKVADLRALPYEDGAFSLVYCISVLEHTQDYARIIREFRRILAPGGRLVITFDLSLDGRRDISLEDAGLLLDALATCFTAGDEGFPDLARQSMRPDVFTTLTAQAQDPALLPWKGPALLHQLKTWWHAGRRGPWPPPLTFACVDLARLP